jgi:hypothetical protein
MNISQQLLKTDDPSRFLDETGASAHQSSAPCDRFAPSIANDVARQRYRHSAPRSDGGGTSPVIEVRNAISSPQYPLQPRPRAGW